MRPKIQLRDEGRSKKPVAAWAEGEYLWTEALRVHRLIGDGWLLDQANATSNQLSAS
jgi:hypothetical protein